MSSINIIQEYSTEVIVTLNEINKSGWLDVVSVGIPIIVSIIAIGISICTANGQNKIALFEKRLAVYDEITSLKVFYDNLSAFINSNNDSNPENNMCEIDKEVLKNLIKTTLQNNSEELKLDFAMIYLARLDRSLTSSWLLFDFITEKDIEQLFKGYQTGESSMYKLFEILFEEDRSDSNDDNYCYDHKRLNDALESVQGELKIFTDKYLKRMESKIKLKSCWHTIWDIITNS